MASGPQYWVIKNKTTGHAVISYGTDPTSSGILVALGAASSAELQTYGAGKDFLTGIEKAFGKLQISSDQIPTQFSPKKGTDIMPVNFDLLTPTGADPNKYQQGVSAAGNAAQTATSAVSNLGAVFGNPDFWIGVGEAVLAIGFLLVGLRALLTGDASVPVPGGGAALKVAKRVA